jgi:hypothetical protein
MGGGHGRLFPRGACWAAMRLQQRYLLAVHKAGRVPLRKTLARRGPVLKIPCAAGGCTEPGHDLHTGGTTFTAGPWFWGSDPSVSRGVDSRS